MTPSTLVVGCIAAQGLLNILLGSRVALLRIQLEAAAGQDHPVLRRAIRAHTNHSEWIPMMCVLMLVADLRGSPQWLVAGLGVALVAVRLMHAWGLSLSTSVTWQRRIGATLTVVIGLGLVAATLL